MLGTFSLSRIKMDIFRISVFENAFFQGEGCALIGRLNKFEQIIRGMNSVLDVPLTVKMRTGIFDNKNIAHTVIPKLRDWGVSMVTVSNCNCGTCIFFMICRFKHHLSENHVLCYIFLGPSV